MSVLIKGMKMPPNCLSCRFLEMSSAYGDFCVLRKKTVKDFNSRLKICPLTELQSHGRLIDADELLNDLITEDYKEHPFCYPCGEIVRAVKNAPVILEAEH